MPAPLIETRGLGRIYQLGAQRLAAVHDVTVAVRAGESVAVMGPSGSGKSTFMNLLGCLDRPTSGSYLFDGVDVAGMTGTALARLRNRSIGFVFQSFNLLPRLTALENVMLPLMYGDTPRARRRGRAGEVLARVGLADRGGHRPAELSGGQQQRVAIARALVNEPALLLADEPTGALDSRTGTEIMALFQELNGRGITLVTVTHDAAVAEYSARILSFLDGALIGDRPVAAPALAAERLQRAAP